MELTCPSSEDYRPTEVKLKDATGKVLYKTAYAYYNGRVTEVKEYDGDGSAAHLGQETFYEYSVAARRTTVTAVEQADGEEAENRLTTVYTFDDSGEVSSSYMYTTDSDNMGAGEGGSGINPYAGDGGASVVSNISNLLLNHDFLTLNAWTRAPGNCKEFAAEVYGAQGKTKFGAKCLRMQTCNSKALRNGVYQVVSLPKGQYAFSVYVRLLTNATGQSGTVSKPGAYLRVTDSAGALLGESERLTSADEEYIRLIVPFELTAAKTVHAGIYIDGEAHIYADAAQLEQNEYANAYNMLTSGNFERGLTGWCNTPGATLVSSPHFNMSKSLRLTSGLDVERYVKQEVFVKSYVDAKETFTLSGWAKADAALPKKDREGSPEAVFRLRARFLYSDDEVEDHEATFSPCTTDWQQASVTFSKERFESLRYVEVYCEYSHNVGSAYFDAIQLTRDDYVTGQTESDFSKPSDASGEGDYSESGDTEEGIAFEEARDSYGNALTETTYENGEFGAVYRSFGYNDPCAPGCPDGGNDLVRETDARGNQTLYKVDADTSRNETVTDRCGNQTAYEYDAAGRMTKLTAKNASGTPLANMSYSYDSFDNLSATTRGDGQSYTLGYNAFHNLESIGVSGLTKPLVEYAYKNGNGRLKEVAYANGDHMYATYNGLGQLVREQWIDHSGLETSNYRYIYDGAGNIVRSLDIRGFREYDYTYESGKLVRASEHAILTNSDDVVTSKRLVSTILYSYDEKGNLTKKRIQPVGGTERVYVYENAEDKTTAVKLPTGVVSHSKTDHLGRKAFDELQLGGGLMNREFRYHEGRTTSEHENAKKLASSPTTSLVSELRFADGRTIAYEYDAEERITKVTDSVEGETGYVYDAQGQLTSETKGGVTTAFTYDAYGNLKTKGTHTYGYDETGWRDRLTSFDGQAITYYTGGNPMRWVNHKNNYGYTMKWRKGRELQSVTDSAGQVVSFSYNANGVRTAKNDCGVVHSYLVDGTKILRESYSDKTLDYLYDNEDSVCGLILNGTAYYFYKNLQGDVIAITNADGVVKARYSYDAWGACTVESDTSGANIASINPFRYRSYYFDVETGFYYLNSRYYDPIVGRFINLDNTKYLGSSKTIASYNLFMYCDNCPVMNSDPSGCASLKFAAIGIQAYISAGVLGFSAGMGVEVLWTGWRTNRIYIFFFANGPGYSVNYSAGIDLLKKIGKNVKSVVSTSVKGNICKTFFSSGVSIRIGIFWVMTKSGNFNSSDYCKPIKYYSVTAFHITAFGGEGRNLLTVGVGYDFGSSFDYSSSTITHYDITSRVISTISALTNWLRKAKV